MSTESQVDLTHLPKIKEQLLQENHRVVVGQSRVIDEMLISLFGGGHCLFIGVPGLAKTLLVNTVSKTMGLDFGRVQFTPDLLPAVITGAEVLEEDKQTGTRSLRFVKGPVFCNMLLADEINRTRGDSMRFAAASDETINFFICMFASEVIFIRNLGSSCGKTSVPYCPNGYPMTTNVRELPPGSSSARVRLRP